MDLTLVLTLKWKSFVENSSANSGIGMIPDFLTFVFESVSVILRFLVGALLAALIGLLNVVVWVIVVFSTAAPMIISGLYEATIDRQVLRAVEKDVLESQAGKTKEKNPHRVKYQIHLLYAVLVGNLKLRGTEDSDDHVERAWADVEHLIEDLDPADEEKAKKYGKEKEKTGARLKTMLACQASFGASIGAPVAFYLGSFLFSVFGNHSKLGDSDVSLALAFGEWWMTLPHVAIVSGCLLAGNNPNTLEAIVSGIDKRISPTNNDPAMTTTKKKKKKKSKFLDGVLASFYPSVYQPVWMWERGRNKANWFKEVKKRHPKMFTTDTDSQDPDSQGPDSQGPNSKVAALSETPESKNALLSWLQKLWRDHLTTPQLKYIPKVGSFQWIFLLLTASILIVVPFVLAYVTSFYTPTIGLSCRTFTFVLYFIFQSLLTMVWFYDFAVKDHEGAHKSIFLYFLAWLFFIGSSFTAIIGTFMQIVGVYRNCLCNIPMGYWGSRDFHYTVSTNTAEGIFYAGRYWLSTGIASICLLVIFCYFGWWYQRHWRSRFDDVVDNILDVKPVVKPSTKKREGFRALKSGKNGSTANLGKTGSATTPEKSKTTNDPEPMGTIPEPAQNNPQPEQVATAPTAGKPGQDDDAIEKVRETTK
jgi:hypothetical protein